MTLHRALAPSVLALVLLGVLAAAGPAAGADLSFLSVVPTEDGWQAEVEGRRAHKDAASLQLLADGVALEVTAEALDKGRARLVARGGVDAERLVLARAAKKGPEQLAALDLVDRGRFSGWTVYHIMLGYFRNGNPGSDGEVDSWRHANWAGGDLQGVLEKADYLDELGVDAVWLSPLFLSATSHGYDVLDYYRPGDQYAVPDDAEASRALLRQVIEALHARDIRVVLDLPLNHAHRAYDRDAGDPSGHGPRMTGPRQDAEKLWHSWGSSYGYWNVDDAATRRFLKEVALHYLVEVGVDGLRLDYVRGVEHAFWSELYAEVKAQKPDAWLLGEAWIDDAGAEVNAADIALYYEPVDGAPQFDSLIDFPMQILATEIIARGGKARGLEEWLQEAEVQYGDAAEPAFFLDNHDLTRFLSWTDEPARLRTALGFLASLSNPLIVFYGTETGLANAGPKPGFLDAGRLAMPWDSLDQALLGHVRAVFAARAAHASLHAGGRLPLFADDESMVFAKIGPPDAGGGAREIAFVGVHLGSEPRALDLAVGRLVSGNGPVDAVLGAGATIEDGRLRWTLPPFTTSIAIRPANQPPE
ncbi:MAG: alpha-amylase family glycosyl hydrolase [Acidobacteriota bacterium]